MVFPCSYDFSVINRTLHLRMIFNLFKHAIRETCSSIEVPSSLTVENKLLCNLGHFSFMESNSLVSFSFIEIR